MRCGVAPLGNPVVCQQTGGQQLDEQYLLEIKNVSKEFFGNRVLKDVNLAVAAGKIHSLVGENGAGKSTLMNILFGMPVIHNTGGFSGEIWFGGKRVDIRSPQDAMNLGIGMVHQEFMLIPGFTITENIKLNREQTKHNLVSRMFGAKMKSLDFKSMRADSRAALDVLGLTIDEMLPVAGLPVGYMQMVEIAREIDKRNVRLLVFDEPTAVLTEVEAQTLINAMRMLAEKGVSILFITHRLEEVLEVSEEITVLRDGEVVASLRAADATVERLAELMVGRKVEKVSLGRETQGITGSGRQVVLALENLHVRMPGEAVRGISMEVYKGEILGIGGLAGQGKLGIANGVMGLYPAEGRVVKEGKVVQINNAASALANGLGFLSEDRRGVGLLLDQSIEFNIAVTAVQCQDKFVKAFCGVKLIDTKAITEHARRMIREVDIRCTGPQQLVRRLSGGNQQKVCIARALTLQPDILFVSEPTRGIDVGAKRIVLELLVRLNRELGMTIVVTSSELAELRAICDRIAIVYRGRLEGILSPDASDREFGLMMTGEKPGRREVS